MTDAQTLRDLGFTYISFDMARNIRITAWRGSERKTYTAYGATVEAALRSLMDQINKPEDTSEEASSEWEDLL